MDAVRQQRAGGLVWKKKEGKGGDRWEQKAGRRLSSVSYISRLNESVQKSELSDQ